MNCPHCGKTHKGIVLESRPHDVGVLRKRACGACGKSYVTLEFADPDLILARSRPDKLAAVAKQKAAQLRVTNTDIFRAWK
jgi:transcriptional regulator NrdR family protein